MRRYRPLVKTATGVSFTPIGASTHRKTAAAKVCTAILNCFGLPSVSSQTAIANMKQNVWDHLGFDFFMAIAEGLNLFGVAGTGIAGGVPAVLVTGAISVPLVVPSTCRLFLTMSADLILVLILSFKQVALQSRQPQEKDFQNASRDYRLRGYSEHVHLDIKTLIPRRSLAASYKYDKIRDGLESIVDRYKNKLMEGEKLPSDAKSRRGNLDLHEDEDDARIIHQVSDKLVELEGSQPTELPTGKEAITTELPVHEKPVELAGDEPPRYAVELSAERRGSTKVHLPEWSPVERQCSQAQEVADDPGHAVLPEERGNGNVRLPQFPSPNDDTEDLNVLARTRSELPSMRRLI